MKRLADRKIGRICIGSGVLTATLGRLTAISTKARHQSSVRSAIGMATENNAEVWWRSAHDEYGHIDGHCTAGTGILYSKRTDDIDQTTYERCRSCWRSSEIARTTLPAAADTGGE